MKNQLFYFIIIFVFILTILTGCNTSEYENTLFSQYINIMNYDYEIADFNLLLNNKNEDIQYNTIINLFIMAEDNTDRMQDNSTDKNEKETLQKLFNRILDLTNSRNPRIAASSLRYISFCIDKYNDKKSLLDKILKIKSNNRLVVFEQVRALSMLVNKDRKIDKKIINRLLKSKSWLISRTTYDLINSSEDIDLRNKMIIRYKNNNDEFEKLLILRCFGKNFGNEVFELFKNEIISTKSKRIKKTIFRMLNNASDIESVINWLNENYKNFSIDDIKNIAVNCYSYIYEDYSIKLFIMLLKNGFDPFIDPYSDTDNTPKLFYYLFSNEKEYGEKISKIEDEIMARKDLKDRWIKYKKEDKNKK